MDRTLDENMKVGATFMDLWKAFDPLNHRIILAKHKAYGLQPTALKQMENYLTGRFQRTKMNNSWCIVNNSRCPPRIYFRTAAF